MKTRVFGLMTLSGLVGCGGSGNVVFNLTDAPTDQATAVYVTVASVEVHHAVDGEDGDGEWTVVAEPNETFDLLQLRDGVTENLGEVKLPEGEIDQIRLRLSEARPPEMVTETGTYLLTIPSAFHSGVKIHGCFAVKAEETTDITLDFDAEKSIHETGSGAYMMRPSIHVKNGCDCEPKKGKAKGSGECGNSDPNNEAPEV